MEINRNINTESLTTLEITSLNLRILRDDRGISRKQLSERTGIPLESLRKAEAHFDKDRIKLGRGIGTNDIVAVAAALHCTLEELLYPTWNERNDSK